MRNDPRWLLGTIVERRGPLSYLVQVANGVVWKRHVETIDSPQEEVTVPEIIDESPTASPLQDPPAVYSN